MHKSCIRCLLVATAISAGSLSLAAAPSALSSRAFGDDTKEKKEKKEDKYTKFFKDKKVETARGKFVTLHKIDGNVYLELPTKYLGKELMMGAKVTSTTDPDYLAVGSMNSAPIIFRFEKQDSVIVMKAPNSIVYRRDASPELQKALELNYRDQSVESFTPEVYKADSSAVVLKINSLVTESSPFFEIVPSQQGPFKITSSRNSSLTFVRGLKAFDSNASVRVEMNFSVNASLMGVLTVAKDMPLTAEVTYTILPVEASNAIPRFADARVGYQTTRKVSFPDYLDQSEPVYLAYRWQLVPKDKKAYAKGQLTEPEKKIVFYLDSAFPASWQRPDRFPQQGQDGGLRERVRPRPGAGRPLRGQSGSTRLPAPRGRDPGVAAGPGPARYRARPGALPHCGRPGGAEVPPPDRLADGGAHGPLGPALPSARGDAASGAAADTPSPATA